MADPSFSAQAQALAQQILTSLRGIEDLNLVLRVAEAQIDLERVRHARHRLIAQAHAEPSVGREKGLPHNHKHTTSLLSANIRNLQSHLGSYNVDALLTAKPDRDAQILVQFARDLTALDRYERSALSRRKSAIRALDKSRSGRG